MVSSLIDPITRQWQTDLVDGLFGEEDAEIIKRIPLSQGAAEDEIFWPFTSSGTYSCKSGYRFLKEEAEQAAAFQPPPLRDKQLWKTIWSMRVAQKVKNFVWRACRNALPTKKELVRRTITADPVCDRCGAAVEDPLHALWSCAELDIVWADQSLWEFRWSTDFENFKRLVSWVIEEGKQLELLAYTAWSVWNQRNQVRVRAAAMALHQIPGASRSLLQEYQSSSLSSDSHFQRQTQLVQQRWKPPPATFVKINFDGAVFSKDKRSGVGAVIRDENGLVLGSCTKLLPQAYSAVEVEALAAATALTLARDLGMQRVILEGDSLIIIKALREEEHFFSPIGLLLEDVRRLSQSFHKLLYSHTKREGNYVAHNLARYANSIPDFSVWMEDVPPCIQSFVQADWAYLR